MSREISKKDAAVVSAAIAAYLARPTTTKAAATSGAAIAQLQRSLNMLLERVEALEKKMDRLEASVNDFSRRVEEMSRK